MTEIIKFEKYSQRRKSEKKEQPFVGMPYSPFQGLMGLGGLSSGADAKRIQEEVLKMSSGMNNINQREINYERISKIGAWRQERLTLLLSEVAYMVARKDCPKYISTAYHEFYESEEIFFNKLEEED